MENELKIAICEDLPEELNHLMSILEESKISLSTSTFTCGEDFLSEYRLHKYDLVFLDIYMDGMTGIETATELRKMDHDITIVFTTSSLDYTLESYRLDALKYIEKPVTLKSVLPVLQLVNMQKEYVPKLSVKLKDRVLQVPTPDILFFEQTGARYNIYLADGSSIVAQGKLVALLEELDSNIFFQCHKSYIVNFSFVKLLNKDLQVFEMLNGEMVHIRRDGFWKTKKAYENYLFNQPKNSAITGHR